LAAIVGALALAGMAAGDSPIPAKPVDGPFDKDLLKIAADYKSWGRIDDEMRWAPELCRIPNPGQAKFSRSSDDTTHGKKLYSLFARHRKEYVALAKDKPVPVDQVIVKESWKPEEITEKKDMPPKNRIAYERVITTANPKSETPYDKNNHFYPYVWKGDKVFKASKQADLFIMMKLDPKSPGTDDGWVYATVTPDGKKVTAAGKIESCMKCHQDAKRDRLFGLK
jgi:hypothetical protein